METGEAHTRCGGVAYASDFRFGNPEFQLRFFKGRNSGFRKYLDDLAKDGPGPRMRFNPRLERDRKGYPDMRFHVDTVRDEAA